MKKKSKWIKLKQWDKVEVLWRDACRQQSGWLAEKEFSYEKADQYADSMHAMGYLMKITENHTYISQQWADSDNTVSHVLSIPTKCIYKIRRFK